MKYSLSIISLLSVIILSSCVGQRKIKKVKDSLKAITTIQETEKGRLRNLNETATLKMQEGKIDSVVNDRISAKLNKYNQEAGIFSNKANDINDLLSNKKKFRKQYKTWVLPTLDSLKKNSDSFNDRLSLYLMIEDGLNIATYQLYDLAAFFGPGKYIVPEDKIDSALLSFEPVIDSLVTFSNKYEKHKRTASLVILGFADGTGFSSEGPLMDTLLSKINNPAPSKEQLNQKLSELRAEELSKQIVNLCIKKFPLFRGYENLKIEYNYQGKGEAYPLPHIKDYTIDDPRRRIVLCYWVVLPD